MINWLRRAKGSWKFVLKKETYNYQKLSIN